MTRAKLLWLDMEMTGLDDLQDVILEVGAIATDWEFAELARYHGIVQHKEGVLEQRMEASRQFWNRFPKLKTVLLKQNASGKSLAAVEDDLLTLMDAHFEPHDLAILAGNSIWNDRRFIRQYMPRFEARLHYRMLDVSSWKLVFEEKFGAKYSKEETHRASDDIRASIDELKFYLEKVRTS